MHQCSIYVALLLLIAMCLASAASSHVPTVTPQSGAADPAPATAADNHDTCGAVCQTRRAAATLMVDYASAAAFATDIISKASLPTPVEETLALNSLYLPALPLAAPQTPLDVYATAPKRAHESVGVASAGASDNHDDSEDSSAHDRASDSHTHPHTQRKAGTFLSRGLFVQSPFTTPHYSALLRLEARHIDARLNFLLAPTVTALGAVAAVRGDRALTLSLTQNEIETIAAESKLAAEVLLPPPNGAFCRSSSSSTTTTTTTSSSSSSSSAPRSDRPKNNAAVKTDKATVNRVTAQRNAMWSATGTYARAVALFSALLPILPPLSLKPHSA